jgi:hypothetical protein
LNAAVSEPSAIQIKVYLDTVFPRRPGDGTLPGFLDPEITPVLVRASLRFHLRGYVNLQQNAPPAPFARVLTKRLTNSLLDRGFNAFGQFGRDL